MYKVDNIIEPKMGKHSKSKKDDKKKDEKKSEEHGFSRFLKKRAPLYLILSTVFLVLLIPELSQSDLESIITSDLSGNEIQAADLVKFYNGPDEEGHRIIDALADRVKTEYEDEKIDHLDDLSFSHVTDRLQWRNGDA